MMKTIAEAITPNADTQEAAPADNAAPQQQGGAAPAQAPKTISLGQTEEEVVAILGEPKKIVNLGAKQIYYYPDMKVVFTDGKVADVQ